MGAAKKKAPASIGEVKAAVSIPMLLESYGMQVLQSGKERKFLAPCHDDHSPSGHLYEKDGSFTWWCFVCGKGGDIFDLARLIIGGSTAEVLRTLADRFNAPRSNGAAVSHLEAVKTSQTVRASKVGTPPKDKGLGTRTRYEVLPGVFHDRIDYSDGSKRVTWAGLAGRKVETVPLWLHEKIAPDGLVPIHEGEKSAEAGLALGLRNSVGTFGTGATPTPESLAFLKDRDVVLFADAHEAGRAHMRKVAMNLQCIARSARMTEFPGVPEGGDAADFLEMHGSDAGRLAAELVAAAKEITVEFDEVEPARERKVEPWPAPMHPFAYCGLLGRIVRGLEPVTEADPVALLASLILMVGSAMGRGVHAKADGARHYVNVFGVLVGPTSSGRKGTATARAMELMLRADPIWAKDCQGSGLSSSEGLISAVRDESVPGADDGVSDKRLLVTEAEFSSFLKQAQRSGNTASEMVRKAFDSGHLRSMTRVTKASPPQRATNAHIGVLGHITQAEMKSTVTGTDIANGLMNRFWIGLVRRSHLLPFGGELEPEVFLGFAREIAEVLDHTRTLGDKEIHLTQESRALWADAYGVLTADRHGLAGNVTSRAAPISLRVALVFSMCDLARAIEPAHLLAGMAFVDYGVRSVDLLFRGIAGDLVEDNIREALEQAGGPMTRTEISHALGRNALGVAIGRALQNLEAAGRVERLRTPKADGPGRPAEKWRISTRHEGLLANSLSGWLNARGGIKPILSYRTDEVGTGIPTDEPRETVRKNARITPAPAPTPAEADVPVFCPSCGRDPCEGCPDPGGDMHKVELAPPTRPPNEVEL